MYSALTEENIGEAVGRLEHEHGEQASKQQNSKSVCNKILNVMNSRITLITHNFNNVNP